MKQFHCKQCHESWPTNKNQCLTCAKDKNGLFTEQNGMIPLLDKLPTQIQKDLENLTQIEEMLISPIVPIMSVYRLSGGRLINSGYCASFAQDIQPICDQLPKLPSQVSLIVIQKKNKENINKDFICDRYRLERVLRFFIANNKIWQRLNITINFDNLNSLPEHGVPAGLNIIYENEQENDPQQEKGPEIIENEEEINEEEENINHAYIEVDIEQAQQIDKVKAKINIPVNKNNNAINEFDYDGILTLAFPKLFPLGYGDPTNKERLIHVDETEAYRHLMKYLCKNTNGDYYYPFAQHPRFLFYAADRLRRHRTLVQSRVYLKNNPNDAALTIKELKEIIDSRDCKYK